MNQKTAVDEILADEARVALEEKILHILKIYPVISPTMLQAGIGPYIKPAMWRPTLQKLIDEGKVVESSESCYTPTDRYNTYAKLSLPGTKVELNYGL